jgi:hypothetical protein
MAKKPRRRRRQSADNDNLISGIYNYCDRWCERCPFTKRCMLFAQEQEFAAMEPEAVQSRDPADPKFWTAITERFAAVRKMIEDDCRERGIDLTMTPEAKQAIEDARKRRHRKVEADPLSDASLRYALSAAEWFKASKELFQEKSRQLVAAAEMALPGSDPPAEAADIVDATQVIEWFHMQIAVKVRRALGGLEREEEHQGEPGDDPFGPDDPELRQEMAEAAKSDSDGSAKVALIGIDRSIEAWGRLRAHLPDQADGLIDTLAHLDRLRREIETRFPGARAFKRPGFDD